MVTGILGGPVSPLGFYASTARDNSALAAQEPGFLSSSTKNCASEVWCVRQFVLSIIASDPTNHSISGGDDEPPVRFVCWLIRDGSSDISSFAS